MSPKRRKLSKLGKYARANRYEAELVYAENCKRFPMPEEELWFAVLLTAIDDYLCGVFSEVVIPTSGDLHESARMYIFGHQEGFNSFDELWTYFYPDIEPSFAKKKLLETYKNKVVKVDAMQLVKEKQEAQEVLSNILGLNVPVKMEVPNAVVPSVLGGGEGCSISDSLLDIGGFELYIEESWAESILFATNGNQLPERHNEQDVQHQCEGRQEKQEVTIIPINDIEKKS